MPGYMKSILIKDTIGEEGIRIVYQAFWGGCGIDCDATYVFTDHSDNEYGKHLPALYRRVEGASGNQCRVQRPLVCADDRDINIEKMGQAWRSSPLLSCSDLWPPLPESRRCFSAFFLLTRYTRYLMGRAYYRKTLLPQIENRNTQNTQKVY